MHLLPEALIERLKTRQAILVTGLGCAELAGLPSWTPLCERLAEWIEDETNKEAFLEFVRAKQLAAAAALLRDLVSTDALAEVLIDAYPASVAQVPESISAVARAPWRGIVTTTFDSVWSTALTQAGEPSERTVLAANTGALGNSRGKFLLQLFGKPNVPESLCLSPAEIAAKVTATGASAFVLDLHKKWSFVFAGFALGDPDLAMLAGRVLGASASTIEHYFVAPGLSALDARRVKAEFGLVPIVIEGSLGDALSALAESCGLAGDKPAADEVEIWIERLTADTDDQEAREMLEQGLATLCERKEWERLVGALINRAEIEPDVQEQSADLYEAGMVLDKELSAPDRAYPVLMMALHLTPQDAELLVEAKRVSELAGQSKEFIDELREIEKETEGAPDGGQMALDLARMLAEDPARREEAIAAFQKLLDRDAANAEAMAGLEGLLRKAERWDALTALFQRALDRDPENTEAAAKLEDIYARTQQTGQLVDLLQGRLARDPADQGACARLEALYQEGQQWQPLAALYERLLARNPDDSEAQDKLEGLYKQTQQWQPLGAFFERQLAKNPANAEVLDKLEDLYRKSEQWKLLAELLERRAASKSADEARAMQLERAGIFIDRLQDTDAALAVARAFLPAHTAAAEEIFARCLERDPGNPAALLAMADLARGKGDHLRAAKFLLDAAERTQSPLERGRLFAGAGSIHLDELGDEARAVECYEQALSSDPEQANAAQRLLALCEKHDDFAGAEPLLDLILRKTEDGATKCDLYQRQARGARKLGKFDKAVSALAAAAKLDSQSYALAHELGDLHFEREAWSEARAEYERAKSLLASDAGSAAAAALCQRLALCATKGKDADAALLFYEEALALEPKKRELLQAVIEQQAAREDWQKVVALKRRLLPLLIPDDEKARLLEDIADILQEKLSDWKGAMAAYLPALELAPERRSIHYKLLDYYTQEKQWSMAIATLEKLASLEDEPATRARCNYAAAAIFRDEVKDTAKAVELFGKVLDDNPLYPKAFEAIEKLLGESKAWKELERAYRKQIKRLPQDASAEMKLHLWDRLAEVALKQHDKESAVLTMEVAISFDRDNLARQERLAKMYFDMGPSMAGKAIAQNQYLISRKSDRLESYKALAALFFQAGAHDKMWCVAGAMTYLGKADPPLRALFENYRPTQAPSAAGKLKEDLWRKIVHPDENPYLSALFALLSPAIAMTTAQPQKVLGLDRHARVDIAGNAWPYAAALRYVTNTIESTVPDVFIKKDAPGTVSLVNLKDKNALAPALVVGIGFDQLTSQSEVIFDLAKRMVQLRPERFPRLALSTGAALEIAVRAGLQLGGSPIGSGEHGREVDTFAKHLDGMLASPLRAELKGLAKRYVEACGEQVDIAKWIIASDLTASRAALALCGDIVAAGRVLAIEPSGQSPLSVQERMDDLLAYFVSDDHFAVRAALGMQVNLTPPSDPPGAQYQRRMSHMQIKVQE